MITIIITKNEENQRLDRFLKKYFRNAPLSRIYKLIRKDVKINGRRGKPEQMLSEGDELNLYISGEEAEEYAKVKKKPAAKRQFHIAYEDDDLIIVEKPFGLLTHGDAVEKKNTLANQVCGYLQEMGAYMPGRERTFVPSPVNRLDRNTTGLVVFGKNNRALQELNEIIRSKDRVSKFYWTITAGELRNPLFLRDSMTKDCRQNKVSVVPEGTEGSKLMETAVRPLAVQNGYSLVEVELITGRTHQIRAHLAKSGYPVIGDVKYGDRAVNRKCRERFKLNTQLLHARKLKFNGKFASLPQLENLEVTAELPETFAGIKEQLFAEDRKSRKK